MTQDFDIGIGPHIAPAMTAESEDFWRGGARGELRICCCDACGTFVHPPTLVCHRCGSTSLAPKAVAGTAILNAFSINYHQWFIDQNGPYIAAIVDLDGAPGVRLTTNVVNCKLSDVTTGMPLKILFHQLDDTWIPLFEPR